MILLAQADGKWLHRVDSGDQDAREFHAEIAAQFGLDPKAVTVVSRSGTSADAEALNVALGSGTFEGMAVIAQPAPSPRTPSPLHAAIDKALASKETGDILAALAALKGLV